MDYFDEYINAEAKARSFHNGIMQLTERLRMMKKNQEVAQKEADRLRALYQEQMKKVYAPCTSHKDESP